MYLYDYHMHSVNSRDGRNTVTDMCIKAVSKGLKEIAVTDHFEPMLGDEKCSYYNPGNYFFDVLRGRMIFGSQLRVKCAVELGQPHLYPEDSLELIRSNPYDYILASVHRAKDHTDFGQVAYSSDNITDYCRIYLDELESLVGWNSFDCIGHLDLVKRYAMRCDVEVNLMNFRDQLEIILRTLIENGKGIEINTSGLRQGAGECLPGLDIVKFYRQLGGEILTIGSDAHSASDVGEGIQDGIEIARLAGFEYITVYSERQPFMRRISQRPAVFTFNKRTA